MSAPCPQSLPLMAGWQGKLQRHSEVLLQDPLKFTLHFYHRAKIPLYMVSIKYVATLHKDSISSNILPK